MFHILKKAKPILFSALFIAGSAMAAGKVTAQKGCSFTVEGLVNPAVDEALKITIQDKKELAAKITAVSKQGADANFLNPKECPNIIGASAINTPKDNPKDTPKKPKFGVSTSLGMHSDSTELAYGASNSFTFTGVSTGLMGEYYASKIQTISLGMHYYRESATISVANSGAEINLTQSGLFLRILSAVNFEIINNYRLIVSPFLDYCLTGAYKIEDKTGTKTYDFASSFRFGGSIGGDYLIMPKLKIGANTNLTMGSFKLGEDYTLSANKTANTLSLGGTLYLGWLL